MSPVMKVLIVIGLIMGLITSATFVSIGRIETAYDAYVDNIESSAAVEATPGLTAAELADTVWMDDVGYTYSFSKDGTLFTDMYGYSCCKEYEPGLYGSYYADEYYEDLDTSIPLTFTLENDLLIMTYWTTGGFWSTTLYPISMETLFAGTEWVDETGTLFVFNGDASLFSSEAESYDTADNAYRFLRYEREMQMIVTADDGTQTVRSFEANDFHVLVGDTSWISADGQVFTFPDGTAYQFINEDYTIEYSLFYNQVYLCYQYDAEGNWIESDTFIEYAFTVDGDTLTITAMHEDGSTTQEQFTRVTE